MEEKKGFNDINTHMVSGNVCADAEFGMTPSGKPYLSFSIGHSRWGNTSFFKCSIWGRLAEILKDKILKGMKVYIVGETTSRKWTDKNGIDRYSTEIRVDQLHLPNGTQKRREKSNIITHNDVVFSDTDYSDNDEIPF